MSANARRASFSLANRPRTKSGKLDRRSPPHPLARKMNPNSLSNLQQGHTRTEIDETQAEYIEWLVTPKDEREPATHGAWADQHDLSYETLRRWRTKTRYFIEAWNKRLEEEHLAPEKIGGMMQRLGSIAQTGGDREAVAAIKLYMEIVGKMAPKKLDIEAGPKARQMSDEELMLAAAAMEEQKALGA